MSHLKPRGSSWDTGLFVHSAVDDSDLDVYEFRVYAHLCRRANDEARVWESQKRIAACCKMGRTKVQSVLYALHEKGWIEIHSVFVDGERRPNDIYLIGPPRPAADPPPARNTGDPLPATRATPARNTGTGSTSIEGNPSPAGARLEKEQKASRPARVEPQKEQQPSEEKTGAVPFFTALCGEQFVERNRAELARWHEEYSEAFLRLAWKTAPTLPGVRVPKVGFIWLLKREKAWPDELTKQYTKDQKVPPAPPTDVPFLGEVRVTKDGRSGRVVEVDTDERKLSLQVGEGTAETLWIPWTVTVPAVRRAG